MRMNQLGDLLKTKRIGRAAHLGPDIESDIEEAEKEKQTISGKISKHY
jgi:hypothetical protein